MPRASRSASSSTPRRSPRFPEVSTFFWVWVGLAVFLAVGTAVSLLRSEEREWARRRWWVMVIIWVPIILGIYREATH